MGIHDERNNIILDSGIDSWRLDIHIKSSVWTRGDGQRYVEMHEIRGSKKLVKKIWKHIRSVGKDDGMWPDCFYSISHSLGYRFKGVVYIKRTNGLIEYCSIGRKKSSVWYH